MLTGSVILTGQFFKLNEYERKFNSMNIVKQTGTKLIPYSVANSIPAGYRDRHIEFVDELVPPMKWVNWYKHSVAGCSAEIRDTVTRRYEQVYKQRLMKIDVHEMFKLLTDGGYPILLCWEREDFTCHRHWISDWFNYYGYQSFEFKL